MDQTADVFGALVARLEELERRRASSGARTIVQRVAGQTITLGTPADYSFDTVVEDGLGIVPALPFTTLTIVTTGFYGISYEVATVSSNNNAQAANVKVNGTNTVSWVVATLVNTTGPVAGTVTTGVRGGLIYLEAGDTIGLNQGNSVGGTGVTKAFTCPEFRVALLG